MNSEESSIQRNTDFFFDTFALVEILIGNEAYAKYFDKPFVITKLNLFELHHYLLREKGESVADVLIERYLPHIAEFDIKVIKKASKFRQEQRRKNLSMTDCIGYIFAKENNLLFISGDKEFEGLENVDFLK